MEGAAIAEYAFSQGYHKIAIAFDASSSAQTLVPNLVKAAGILGLQVVAQPAVPVGAPSYEAVVKQIVDAKPDVIMMQLDPGTAGTFFPALKTLGGTGIPIIGSDVTLDPKGEYFLPNGIEVCKQCTAQERQSAMRSDARPRG